MRLYYTEARSALGISNARRVYIAWCKHEREFGRTRKFGGTGLRKLSRSPKLTRVFASGYVNTASVYYFCIKWTCFCANAEQYNTLPMLHSLIWPRLGTNQSARCMFVFLFFLHFFIEKLTLSSLCLSAGSTPVSVTNVSLLVGDKGRSDGLGSASNFLSDDTAGRSGIDKFTAGSASSAALLSRPVAKTTAAMQKGETARTRCYIEWFWVAIHCSSWLQLDNSCATFNNYSPKWRWIAVDIYRAASAR